MTTEEISQWFSDHENDTPTFGKLAITSKKDAFMILVNHTPENDWLITASEHDHVWFGNVKLEELSENDLKILMDHSYFLDKDIGCLSTFI